MSFDGEHHRFVLWEDGDTGAKPENAGGVDHIGFSCGDPAALADEFERLKDLGITPTMSVNHHFTSSLYYRDPDGNEVEISCDNFPTKSDCAAFMASPQIPRGRTPRRTAAAAGHRSRPGRRQADWRVQRDMAGGADDRSVQPPGTSWQQVYGASVLCGIGFMMSLFIGALAFPGDAARIDAAKIGTLFGSIVSALASWAILRVAEPAPPPEEDQVEAGEVFGEDQRR